MMFVSSVRRSTCRRTFVTTASRSAARLSCMFWKRCCSRPTFTLLRTVLRARGCVSMASTSWVAAFTAPQPSCPMIITTLTPRWLIAYCSEPVVAVSRQLPATRITKMSPRLWSKTISMGTRESEQPSTAIVGHCFVMRARRSKAVFSCREPWPVQKRTFPFCSPARISAGERASASSCSLSARCRDSSIEKPSQPGSVMNFALEASAFARLCAVAGGGGGTSSSSSDSASSCSLRPRSWAASVVPKAKQERAPAPYAAMEAVAMALTRAGGGKPIWSMVWDKN
mmetsp:Transcript_44981/g.127234  ORF Transcript_44981/g.127234 Transcript_44981/m.127234 type:complete len:284 (-) Transcript_44981:7-858(-)